MGCSGNDYDMTEFTAQNKAGQVNCGVMTLRRTGFGSFKELESRIPREAVMRWEGAGKSLQTLKENLRGCEPVGLEGQEFRY